MANKLPQRYCTECFHNKVRLPERCRLFANQISLQKCQSNLYESVCDEKSNGKLVLIYFSAYYELSVFNELHVSNNY